MYSPRRQRCRSPPSCHSCPCILLKKTTDSIIHMYICTYTCCFARRFRTAKIKRKSENPVGKAAKVHAAAEEKARSVGCHRIHTRVYVYWRKLCAIWWNSARTEAISGRQSEELPIGIAIGSIPCAWKLFHRAWASINHPPHRRGRRRPSG